jgi:hypothetical protein
VLLLWAGALSLQVHSGISENGKDVYLKLDDLCHAQRIVFLCRSHNIDLTSGDNALGFCIYLTGLSGIISRETVSREYALAVAKRVDGLIMKAPEWPTNALRSEIKEITQELARVAWKGFREYLKSDAGQKLIEEANIGRNPDLWVMLSFNVSPDGRKRRGWRKKDRIKKEEPSYIWKYLIALIQ